MQELENKRKRVCQKSEVRAEVKAGKQQGRVPEELSLCADWPGGGAAWIGAVEKMRPPGKRMSKTEIQKVAAEVETAKKAVVNAESLGGRSAPARKYKAHKAELVEKLDAAWLVQRKDLLAEEQRVRTDRRLDLAAKYASHAGSRKRAAEKEAIYRAQAEAANPDGTKGVWAQCQGPDSSDQDRRACQKVRGELEKLANLIRDQIEAEQVAERDRSAHTAEVRALKTIKEGVAAYQKVILASLSQTGVDLNEDHLEEASRMVDAASKREVAAEDIYAKSQAVLDNLNSSIATAEQRLTKDVDGLLDQAKTDRKVRLGSWWDDTPAGEKREKRWLWEDKEWRKTSKGEWEWLDGDTWRPEKK